MNDESLQVPMHRAHVAAALTGEGEVHIAETPDEGVVGVAVWCARHQLYYYGPRSINEFRFGPGYKFLSTLVEVKMRLEVCRMLTLL